MNISSSSSCFHNLFSGQSLWFLQCLGVIGMSGLGKPRRKGGVVGYGGRSAARGPMCWPLWSLVMFEKTTGMCVGVNGCPWQVSLWRDSGKRQDAYPWRSYPTLCANLGPAASAWWGRKIFLPPFLPPMWEAPWPEYRVGKIILAL